MRRLVHILGGLFGLAMFAMAIGVLQRQLKGHTVTEIFHAAKGVESESLLLATLLTVLCYLVLTGYDLLATRQHRGELKTLSVMLNSFICHAMSMNVGFSSLTGGSIRCCYYLRKGLPPMDVVKIVSFCFATFWLGFLTLSGAILMIAPPTMPSFIPLPFTTLQPLGALFLVAVLGYLLMGVLQRKPLFFQKWMIPVIPTRVSLAQILVACSEWLFGAAVLWILLPAHPEFSYFHLLSFYVLAQVSGLFSQVPSGLGVFESVVLALVPSDLNPSVVVGSLLLYRLMFSLVPLSIAGLLLLLREAHYRRCSVAPVFTPSAKQV